MSVVCVRGDEVILPCGNIIWLYKWEKGVLYINPIFKQLWNLLIWNGKIEKIGDGCSDQFLIGKYIDLPGDGPNRSYIITPLDTTASSLVLDGNGKWQLLESPYGLGPVTSVVDDGQFIGGPWISPDGPPAISHNGSIVMDAVDLNYRISWSGNVGSISFYSQNVYCGGDSRSSLMISVCGDIMTSRKECGSYVTWNYKSMWVVPSHPSPDLKLFVEIMTPDRYVDEAVPSTHYLTFETSPGYCGVSYKMPVYRLEKDPVDSQMVNVISDRYMKDLVTSMYKYLWMSGIVIRVPGTTPQSRRLTEYSVSAGAIVVNNETFYPMYEQGTSTGPPPSPWTNTNILVDRSLRFIGLRISKAYTKCVVTVKIDLSSIEPWDTVPFSFRLQAMTTPRVPDTIIPMIVRQKVTQNGEEVWVEEESRSLEKLDPSPGPHTYTTSLPIAGGSLELILILTFLSQSGIPLSFYSTPLISFPRITIS
jgi:hypothetical protein